MARLSGTAWFFLSLLLLAVGIAALFGLAYVTRSRAPRYRAAIR